MRRYVWVVLIGLILCWSSVGQASSTEDKNFYVGYKKGFYLKSGNERYSLVVNGRLQVFYLFDRLENIDGAADFDGVDNTFQIRRFYLYFSGNFFDPKLKYLLNIIPSASGRIIGDAYLNYAVDPAFEVRGGSFKLQMNRQEYTSSGKQQFVDRSLANERFNLGRSTGVSVFGTLADKKFEYYLFGANGRETNANPNTLNEMLGGLRLAVNPLGEFGYSESDTEFSSSPLLTFGVGGAVYKEDTTRTTDQDLVVVGSADVGLKYLGFSFQGEFFARDANPNASTAPGSDTNNNQVNNIQSGVGGYAQLGYFIVPRYFEAALRGSSVFYTLDADDHEFTGGLNYFFSGHNLKLQLDYSWLLIGQNTGAETYQDEHRVRLQSTLSF